MQGWFGTDSYEWKGNKIFVCVYAQNSCMCTGGNNKGELKFCWILGSCNSRFRESAAVILRVVCSFNCRCMCACMCWGIVVFTFACRCPSTESACVWGGVRRSWIQSSMQITSPLRCSLRAIRSSASLSFFTDMGGPFNTVGKHKEREVNDLYTNYNLKNVVYQNSQTVESWIWPSNLYCITFSISHWLLLPLFPFCLIRFHSLTMNMHIFV